MKKVLAALLAIMLVFSLAACGSGDSSLWKANDVFENVTVCKYGDVISADFGTAMSVKIKGIDYDHFVKYIEDMKKDGFTFLQSGDIPENFNLYDGQAQWRCTDGKVYLQLIFAEDKSSAYDMFGCNLQIFGYNESSYLVPETKKDKKDKKDKKIADSKTETTSASK